MRLTGRIAFGFLGLKPPFSHSARVLLANTRVAMSYDAVESTHPAADLLNVFRSAIPPLDGSTYKGQHGRVGVVGGSADYIGAPYFAASASLRAGGDLATVFCAPAAAVPLKALSPDIMVSPTLEVSDAALGRLRSLVIGPGLGRDPGVVRPLENAVRGAYAARLPLVLDADALWHLSSNDAFRRVVEQRPDDVPPPVLTPNAPELVRLTEADTLNCFALIAKGKADVVTVGNVKCIVSNDGSLKRVGGQGDILAGLAGLFISWVDLSGQGDEQYERLAAAAVAACAVTRRAAHAAFVKKRRSLVTSDIIEELGIAMEELEDGTLSKLVEAT